MWRQIRSNRRRSVLVVAGMAALLLACGAAIGVLAAGEAGLLLGAAFGGLLWLILWAVASSGGDDLMLTLGRAREVPEGGMQQLRNVLEEMSVAASLDQVPRLFVIDDPSPNAFATGRKPDKSAVAVTTGLLAVLDRDELQGVVAHEVAHIKNQDVKLLVLAGVMLGSIVMLADAGRRMLWFGGGRRSRGGGDGGGNALAALLAILVVVLGPLLAQLFYFSLSRRREYLADASAAVYTRYPEGLARALEKIGGSPIPSRSDSRVVAPMYISAPRMAGAGRAVGLFSTHPPIQERVRILRGMAGGAGYAAYEQAYRGVHGGSLMTEGDLQAGRTPAGAVGIAGAGAAGGPPPVPPAPDGPAERRARVREASDTLLRADGYRWQSCAACGAVTKVPPKLAGTVRRCPRCGETYAQ